MLRARPTTSLALGLAVPLAAIAAIAALATFQSDPVAAAETGYLALAAGAVLLAAAGVAGRPTSEGLVGALLTVTAIWALPTGPARGAAATALAAAVLALSALRRSGLLSPAGPPPGAPAEGDGPPPGALALAPAALVPLAVGLQALLRGGDLLATGPALRTLAIFVALPVAGALAVVTLAGFEGWRRALLAAAVALAAGPGFRPATVLAIAALAAGAALAPGPDAERRWRALGVPPDHLLRRLPRGASIAAAAAVLVLPFAWSWRAAAVSAAAALALAAHRLGGGGEGEGRSPRRRALRLAPPLAIGGLVLAVAALLPGRDPAAALALASLLLLALPALALAAVSRGGLALAAVLLALAAARGVPVAGPLAAPLALGALAIERRGARAATQAVWAGILLAVTAVASAYPWLRPAPVAAALALFGFEVTWPYALAAAAGLALLALGAMRWVGWRGARGALPRLAGCAVALAAAGLLVMAIPRRGALLIADQAVELGSGRTVWRGTAGGDGTPRSVRAREVLIDSSLANAGGLAAGTPVATLRLAGAHGQGRPLTWTLRVGDDTGEWAAGRADLAAAGLAPAPARWLSWVAEGGEFFGGRYRAERRIEPRRALADEAAVETAELRLRPDLPPGVTLTVFHLELRP